MTKPRETVDEIKSRVEYARGLFKEMEEAGTLGRPWSSSLWPVIEQLLEEHGKLRAFVLEYDTDGPWAQELLKETE